MLSDFGSWASIISLPITIWVLIETFRLKGKFAARIRIPEIRKDLVKVLRSLLGNMKPQGDRLAAYSDLAKAAALLKNLQTQEGLSRMLTLNDAIRQVDRMVTSRDSSDNDFWIAYQTLTQIITSLEQIERDMPWS